jgi:hypothetical protein
VPLIVAVFSAENGHPAWRVVVALLLFCLPVYAVTDFFNARFEIGRDVYFLGTGSVVLFIFAAWLASSYRSRNWLQVTAAALVTALSAFANFVLLWMISYFE